MNVGSTLKQQRVAKGLSLQKLSEMTGISIVTICHCENGIRLPNVNKLGVLAEALDLDYDMLFEMWEKEKKE